MAGAHVAAPASLGHPSAYGHVAAQLAATNRTHSRTTHTTLAQIASVLLPPPPLGASEGKAGTHERADAAPRTQLETDQQLFTAPHASPPSKHTRAVLLVCQQRPAGQRKANQEPPPAWRAVQGCNANNQLPTTSRGTTIYAACHARLSSICVLLSLNTARAYAWQLARACMLL